MLLPSRITMLAQCGVFVLAGSGLTMAEPVALPSSADNWINTAPLSIESLEGKGAVLWFFEEQ